MRERKKGTEATNQILCVNNRRKAQTCYKNLNIKAHKNKCYFSNSTTPVTRIFSKEWYQEVNER